MKLIFFNSFIHLHSPHACILHSESSILTLASQAVPDRRTYDPNSRQRNEHDAESSMRQPERNQRDTKNLQNELESAA